MPHRTHCFNSVYMPHHTSPSWICVYLGLLLTGREVSRVAMNKGHWPYSMHTLVIMVRVHLTAHFLQVLLQFLDAFSAILAYYPAGGIFGSVVESKFVVAV